MEYRKYFFKNVFKFKGSIIFIFYFINWIIFYFLYFISRKEFIKQFIGDLFISNPPKNIKNIVNNEENDSVDNEKLKKIYSTYISSKIKKEWFDEKNLLNNNNTILNKKILMKMYN